MEGSKTTHRRSPPLSPSPKRQKTTDNRHENKEKSPRKSRSSSPNVRRSRPISRDSNGQQVERPPLRSPPAARRSPHVRRDSTRHQEKSSSIKSRSSSPDVRRSRPIRRDSRDRYGNKRKVGSPRSRDDRDRFASSKNATQRSPQPHRNETSASKSSRTTLDVRDSQRCKCLRCASPVKCCQSRRLHDKSPVRKSPPRKSSMDDPKHCWRCKCEKRRQLHEKSSSRRSSSPVVRRSRPIRRDSDRPTHRNEAQTSRTSKSNKISDNKDSKTRDSRSSQPHRGPSPRKGSRNSSTDVSDFRRHRQNSDNKKQTSEDESSDEQSLEERRRMRSPSIQQRAVQLLEMSENYMTEGNLKRAFKCISKAIAIHKKENKLTSKLYSMRGSIYTLMERPKCSFQGFLDFERAYIIDKENIDARLNMAKYFFMGANKLFRQRQYNRAFTTCKHALDLHKNYGDASILLTLIKKKLHVNEARIHAMKEAEDRSFTPPSKKCIPERISALKQEHHQDVCEEVKRLNKKVGECLKSNNYVQALEYCDLALRLLKTDLKDDSSYCDLLLLKQQIIDSME